jgi:hypothetical protein
VRAYPNYRTENLAQCRNTQGIVMARVVALYRYPLKGFSPEPCERLSILANGRVAGDRVLNVRFANAPVADDQWCRC